MYGKTVGGVKEKGGKKKVKSVLHDNRQFCEYHIQHSEIKKEKMKDQIYPGGK